MTRILEKCKKLMNGKQINEGVIQVNKAMRSLEQTGRQINLNTSEGRRRISTAATCIWHYTRMAGGKWKGDKKDDNNNETMDRKNDELGKNSDEIVDGKEE
eukprot:4009034-Pleurochrysis_carterae.AAC.1